VSDQPSIPLFDFVKGEVRLLTPEEHMRRCAEWAKRTTVKDGVVWVDCKPPGRP
jgi:hypothetical protein